MTVQNRSRWILYILALAAAIYSFSLTRGTIRQHAAENADFYCYTFRDGWACSYQRQECARRQAMEAAGAVTKGCKAQYEEVLTP